jgi:hypothetical protein
MVDGKISDKKALGLYQPDQSIVDGDGLNMKC